MFINENTSNNILKYQIESRLEIDEFAMRILRQGEIDGVFVPGVSGTENGVFLLIPVAKSVTLEKYLLSEAERNGGINSLVKIADLMRQAIHIDKSCAGHMMGKSVLIKNFKYAYVTDDKLQLICLPVASAKYESNSDRDFYRSIIVSGIYSEEEWSVAGALINFINSNDFTLEEFLFRLDKITENRVDNKNDETDNLEIEIELLPEDEGGPSVSGFLKKIKSFFFPKSNENEMLEKSQERVAPNGIYVLAVRSTAEEYPICFGPDVIGTDENTCSICFPESNVISENHCRVYFDKNRFYLEDLGSKLGTYLNNEKMQPNKAKVIVHGDLIRVGNEELVFSRRIPS